jgi:hypothetical protein
MATDQPNPASPEGLVTCENLVLPSLTEMHQNERSIVRVLQVDSRG